MSSNNIWFVPWEPPPADLSKDTSSGPRSLTISRPRLATDASSASSSPKSQQSSAPRRTQKQLAEDREASIRAVTTTAPRQKLWISWLRSASIERLKFQATFVELFFDRQGSRFPGFEYILRSADQSPALLNALDATCLIHVGTTHRDERLLAAARMTYGSSIAKVRRDILDCKGHASLLVAAVYLLTICEFFSALAEPQEGWRRHVRGIMHLLGALDLTVLDPSIRILVGTFLRGPAVWDGISERKGLPALQNIQKALDDGHTFSSSTDFIRLAVRVPSVIEKVDVLCHASPPPAQSALLASCNEIVALVDQLRSWMASWLTTLEEEPFQVLPISMLSEDQSRSLKQDTVFPMAYRFSSPLLAPKHRSYWTCMLSLFQAHLDIFESFSDNCMALQSYDYEMLRIIEMATECADSICMTVAFDTQPENGYVALFSAMTPLEMAAAWYKRQGNGRKLQYCRQAMRIFRAAGLQTSEI